MQDYTFVYVNWCNFLLKHMYCKRKRPTNASLIQCNGVYYTPTCFGILECHHQGVRYEHAEMVPNVVGSREGWELYIVTDSVTVWIISRPLRLHVSAL
jgi:hypothetical protein